MGESLVDSCTSKAMDSEKFCLKWNEFEDNIRNSFKSFRSEGTLFDVTLATDDGHQIQAHKVILSAGSDFFRNIFSQCNQSNMLVYLKGISRVDLENVTNFLYNGETLVTQQDLNTFLETAQELKVTGLQNVEDDNKSDLDLQENEFHRRIDNPLGDTKAPKTMAKSNDDTFQQYLNTPSETKLIVPADNAEYVNQELNEQLGNLIEKSLGGWRCKVCNKATNNLTNKRQHAETHIQGAIHSCSICQKSFSTSSSMRVHVNNIHSKLYFCNVCGKEDMNKMTVHVHKKKCNGTPEVQV